MLFKKKVISSMLALGLVTSNLFVSNADMKVQQASEEKVSSTISTGVENENSRNSQGKWVKENGFWYFHKNGVTQKGWVQVNGSWYYLKASGVMGTGWEQISGKWYYLRPSGVMATGWEQVNGKWYYLENSGIMTTGWKKLSNKWYYFNSNGSMQIGWKQISGNWHYFYSGGTMATNTTIDGWKIDNSGVGRKIVNITSEYKSALAKAKQYSDIMAMSKRGIYDQLISPYGEKFSKEAAQYAVDNVKANWKENALIKAKQYQDIMAMSPSAIYDQLISEYGEQFTPEEAQYAIDNLK